MIQPDRLRLAAVADIHYGRHSAGSLADLFARASDEADVLLLCGDLTDYGLPEEAILLARDLRANVRIPVLAVLGNHDFESDQPRQVREVLEQEAGVVLLDGECTEVAGVGFAGVRGFAGGFGQWSLNAWGEPVLKAFVKEAVDEALKLEAALNRLHTAQRVVLMHYSPIRETVEGEPCDIYPFMGSSRLETPLNQFGVAVAFHGHAHAGHPEGHTSAGIPVFNVGLPVLKRNYPEGAPFRLFELPLEATAEAGS